jgi:hypothetical protein
VDRQPVEHAPDKWRGELDGPHISHNGESIPVTVRVQWTDGTDGEVNAWTSQWTALTSASTAKRRRRITRSGCEPQTSGGASEEGTRPRLVWLRVRDAIRAAAVAPGRIQL